MGYEPIDVRHSGMWFGGLEKSSRSDFTLLDGCIGSAAVNYTYFSVGTSAAWNGGIPAYSGATSQMVELYVKTNQIIGSEFPLSIPTAPPPSDARRIRAQVAADRCDSPRRRRRLRRRVGQPEREGPA